jgi:hypothetical protein
VAGSLALQERPPSGGLFVSGLRLSDTAASVRALQRAGCCAGGCSAMVTLLAGSNALIHELGIVSGEEFGRALVE